MKIVPRNLSASQWRRIAAIKEQIEQLEAQLRTITDFTNGERALKTMLEGGRIHGRTKDWLRVTRQ